MNLTLKIKTFFCLWLIVGGNFAYASSYSSNFSVRDEAVDFAHNSDYLKSSSYSMDLSGISWTDRPSESASFKIIDSNSDLEAVPTPPPSGGGGNAGGRPQSNVGENDTAIIGLLPKDEKPDLNLHGVAKEKPAKKPSMPKTSKIVRVETAYDDFDGCSALFEMIYMNTNPYKNDTDDDGVGDCDETWIYDTNPIVKNDNFVHTGIAKAEDFIYTQKKPLFIGRGDFGNSKSYIKDYIQLAVNLIEPESEMGMFFLNLKNDMNFVGMSEIELESGQYDTTLYHDGGKQEESNYININLDKEYEDLFVNVPEKGMLNNKDRTVYISGETGKGYGVVAIWASEDNLDVSATVAGDDGVYSLSSPEELEDGDYSIYIYAVYKEDGKLIQTNYQTINIKMQKSLPYIVEKIQKRQTPKWETAYNYAKTQIDEKKIEAMHSSAKKTDPMYLLSYGVFFTIVLISYFVIWKRED